MSEYYNPKADGAQMSFDGRMSYGDYLNLEYILNAQKPLSGAHDEMLFIIQHQTSELWMKLCVHELLSARLALQNDNLPESFKMLTRVARIMEQLNNAWDVLRTMTPSEYTQFRDDLGQSSGFQSHQYRQIEFILGNRNRSLLKPHEHQPRIHELLLEELDTPSLYDEVIFLLRRQGLEIEDCALKRNSDQPYESNASVLNAWRQVYLDPEKYWSCYELGEKCVDVEDYFRRWRFNHLTTVQRIIGFKRGTGGTSGVHYLKRMLDVELFPELWDVRTEL